MMESTVETSYRPSSNINLKVGYVNVQKHAISVSKFNLRILQINSQCVRNKVSELEHLASLEKIDIICISEHWLRESQIPLFTPSGYTAVGFVCRKTSKNGGAGIFVSPALKYTEIDLSMCNAEHEIEISGIKLNGLSILSLYRPPSGDIQVFFDNFEKAVKKVLKLTTKIIICGDYNIQFLKTTDPTTVSFLNIVRTLNLRVTNNLPTRKKSCLDNILVNFSEELYDIRLLIDCISDHDPLLFNFNSCDLSNRLITNSNSNRNFVRRQNENQIAIFIEALQNEGWEMISLYINNLIDVKTLFDSFFNRYVNLWHSSSPLVESKGKLKTKKFNWFNEELRKSRELMLSYHNVYRSMERNKSVQAEAAHKVYLFFKQQYKVKINNAKRQSYEHFIETSNNKCKAAWEVISRETQSTTTTQKANLNPDQLNNYFVDSVSDIQGKIPHTNTSAHNLVHHIIHNAPEFHWSTVTPEEVIKTVSRISNSRSTDVYWISNYLLKRTVGHFSDPLTFVLNQCLIHGYFSDLLKVSKVTPVFKKGDKTQPQNYRPISIVPIFSKIFESLLYTQLVLHFESNNLISNCQHGFRSNRSTTTAVSNLVDDVLLAFEKKESVSLMLCDLSKAFDCVQHDVLLSKLCYYGISENSLLLLQSYLSNRKQYVSVNGLQSSTLSVNTGVPQGSVLGPFLFIVFINDLPNNIPSKTIIYADDTTLLSSHSNLDDLVVNLSQAHNSAQDWFSSNKLLCNGEKTQEILLSLTHAEDYQSVKLLGFYIDNGLNWRSHINNICNKISRVTYLMWKLRDFVGDEYLRVAYFAFLQSHVSYGIILWGHSSAVHDILLIQKKVVRTMCRVNHLEHCKPLFIKLKFMTVINLYIYHLLTYTKLHITDFNDRQSIHHHNTRGKNKIDLPHHRLAKTGNSFKFNCIKFFNRLPSTARQVSMNKFRSTLREWLIANPFYSIEEFLECNLDFKF